MHRLTFSLLPAFLASLSTLSAADQAEMEALRTQAAGGGEVKVQLELAFRYRDGRGVAKDDAEAMKWAHRAADGGSADAMDFVGYANAAHPAGL